jgi:ferredoxin
VEKPMRIRVDPEKCQGHNRCKAVAPELFVLDRFGNSSAVGDGRVPPGFAEKARLAIANCPELAIEIVEDWSERAP